MFFEILALKKVNEILLAKEGNIVSLYPFVKKGCWRREDRNLSQMDLFWSQVFCPIGSNQIVFLRKGVEGTFWLWN